MCGGTADNPRQRRPRPPPAPRAGRRRHHQEIVPATPALDEAPPVRSWTPAMTQIIGPDAVVSSGTENTDAVSNVPLPSVSSAVPLVGRSFQHWRTFQSQLPAGMVQPFVIESKYLVQVNHENSFEFFDLEAVGMSAAASTANEATDMDGDGNSTASAVVESHHSVSTTCSGDIVDVVLAPTSLLRHYKDEGHTLLVALTVHGHIVILSPQRILHTLSTPCVGATCLACTTQKPHSIIVGTTDGDLCCFAVKERLNLITSHEPRQVELEMQWQVSLDALSPGRYTPSIRHVHLIEPHVDFPYTNSMMASAPTVGSNANDDASDDSGILDEQKSSAPDTRVKSSESENETKGLSQQPGNYLMVTLGADPTRFESTDQGEQVPVRSNRNTSRPHRDAGTSARIRILNLSCIATGPDMNNDKSTDNTARDAECVSAATVAARPGRQVRDARSMVATTSLDSGGQAHYINVVESPGTDRILCLGDGQYAVALSDGTVALLRLELRPVNIVKLDTGDQTDGGDLDLRLVLQWAVHKQILLSHACIGMNVIELADEQHPDRNGYGLEQPRSLICALRSGTLYGIPLSKETAYDHSAAIRTYAYPVIEDTGTDDQMQYVQAETEPLNHLQGFTATNLPRLGHIGHCGLPLVLYSWPGGIIDAFACHMVSFPTTERHRLWHELVATGSVEALYELLKSFAPTGNPSSDDSIGSLNEDLSLWRNAAASLVETTQAPNFADLANDRYPPVSRLLMRLADPDDTIDWPFSYS